MNREKALEEARIVTALINEFTQSWAAEDSEFHSSTVLELTRLENIGAHQRPLYIANMQNRQKVPLLVTLEFWFLLEANTVILASMYRFRPAELELAKVPVQEGGAA